MGRSGTLAVVLLMAASPTAAAQKVLPPGTLMPGQVYPGMQVVRTAAPPYVGGTGGGVSMNGPPRVAPSPAAAKWARDVVVGDGWTAVALDERGLVLASEPGPIETSGIAGTRLRLEYRTAFEAQGLRPLSVQADVRIYCEGGTVQVNKVTAYSGPNLSGTAKPVDLVVDAKGGYRTSNVDDFLALFSDDVIVEQCARAGAKVAAKYGPEWKALSSSSKAVVLVKTEPMGADLQMRATFRVESSFGRSEKGSGKWRSALVAAQLDCATGFYRLDAKGFPKPGLEGQPFALINAAAPPTPDENAPGKIALPPPPPAWTLLDATTMGGMFARPCKAALSRLGERLAAEGSPERAAATAWLGTRAAGKGWREPTLTPLGGAYVSEEVVARPTGERVSQIREEFFHPVVGKAGALIASRISVVDIDCAGRQGRIIGLFEYAANGAKQLVKEERDYNARWLPVGRGFTLSRYVDAICEAQAIPPS